MGGCISVSCPMCFSSLSWIEDPDETAPASEGMSTEFWSILRVVGRERPDAHRYREDWIFYILTSLLPRESLSYILYEGQEESIRQRPRLSPGSY